MNSSVMSVIEAIQQDRDANGVQRTFSAAISRYGFDKFIISGLPDPGLEARPLVLLSGWDREWFERYANLGYVHVDPVAKHCFRTNTPFLWSDAPYDRENDVPARRFMDEARDFEMDEGFCVPVHMEGGMQGGVSLAGDVSGLTSKSRVELHMLSLYTHGRLRALANESEARARRAITPREAEVLQWVAVGKTASEIADITGLSKRTVNQHCENAQSRLGTNNRVHTVVEAIRHKLISL